MKVLADKAGLDLPLWPERCADEQRVKLRVLPNVAIPPARMEKTRINLSGLGGSLSRGVELFGNIPLSTIRTTTASNDENAVEAIAS